jgi:hypothetical protein
MLSVSVAEYDVADVRPCSEKVEREPCSTDLAHDR